MAEWITKEAACEAVLKWALVRGDIYAPTVPTEKAIAAIRALPAPEPVGEDELVESGAGVLYSACEVEDVLTPESRIPWLALREEWRNHYREVFRAVLSFVRAHDRREADEVREVLRDAIPILRAEHDRTYQYTCDHDGEYCHCDAEAKSIAFIARAERAAKVAP